MKTKQIGYYQFPNEGLNLHFSINSWFNLEEDTGLTSSQFLTEFGTELQKEDKNEFILLDLITDLCLAAARAYAQEEELEFDYNRFKMRNDVMLLGEQGMVELSNVIFNNTQAVDKMGKQTPMKVAKKKS
jgi:hypothetical protein